MTARASRYRERFARATRRLGHSLVRDAPPARGSDSTDTAAAASTGHTRPASPLTCARAGERGPAGADDGTPTSGSWESDETHNGVFGYEDQTGAHPLF